VQIVICPKGSKCFFTETIPEELLGRTQKVFHVANLLERIPDAVNRVFLSPRIEVPAENLKNFESSHEFNATSRANRKKGDFENIQGKTASDGRLRASGKSGLKGGKKTLG
jgi:hypothetical protein